MCETDHQMSELEHKLTLENPPHVRKLTLAKLALSEQLNSPERIEKVLIRILNEDEDPVVRHEAAFALGLLTQRELIPGVEAVRALCRSALEDRSILVRHESTEALDAFSGPLVHETLEKLRDDPAEDVKATAELVLGALLDRDG